jgi:hypothetical protein
MPTAQLRDAASKLEAAADYADDPAKANAAFNWPGLISLLVKLIPMIIALFAAPAPAPEPVPTPK